MEQQKTVALSTAEAEYLALYVQLSVGCSCSCQSIKCSSVLLLHLFYLAQSCIHC